MVLKTGSAINESIGELVRLVPNFVLMIKTAEELAYAKEIESSFVASDANRNLHKLIDEAKELIFYLRKPLLGVRGIALNLQKFKTFLEFQLRLNEMIGQTERKDLALILTRPYVYYHATFRNFSPMRQDDDPHIQELSSWVVEHIRFISLLKLIAVEMSDS